ncbi:MAG: hypothetical protein ACT4P7_19605 [Gemmatimonadaceae bacterium]
MSNGREAVAGATRICPHCRAKILESASVCPGCKHHLRFDPGAAARAIPSLTPLRVEGRIHHPPDGDPWEYSVVMSIRNEKGEEVSRQVVGVGALQPHEERTFTVSVEMFTPVAAKSSIKGR